MLPMASVTRLFRQTSRGLATISRTLTTTAQRYDAAHEKSSKELGVGELQGAKFKIEPLRRIGEDGRTMRARLLCSSFHSSRNRTAD
jgi:hypothetical protein